MTRRLSTGAWLLVALLASAGGSYAQVHSIDTSQPIVIRVTKPADPRIAKFVGQFVSSTPAGITLRDPKNSYSVRTFSYGPAVRAQMQGLSAKGGYRYGDKVEIECVIGSTVALRIKGKPSSPKGK